MDKELFRIKLDFDKLIEWRDETMNGVPITGCLSFYRACGLISPIQEHFSSESEELKVCPINNIKCNFYTMKRIKNFIENIWSTFNIDLLGDNSVDWIKGQSKNQRKRPKKRPAVIRHSVALDFAQSCPGLDDDLPDDILVLVKYVSEEQSSENSIEIGEKTDKIAIVK